MPITTGTAILLGSIAAASAGATVYSAHEESKAAKKAAESQENIAKMEIAEANKASTMAAQEAKSKLKYRRASQTRTILSDPNDEANTNQSVLGVG